ncbi:hypothetical protein [Pseudomonas sp.]|uniref:hypothetical protein n=1 Tax=Pseudomonas sp. TaxID=306 RepID=UPI0028A86ACA|nr:hypothetical protein [Pseudomonas sp.]
MRTLLLSIALTFTVLANPALALQGTATDDQIAQRLIDESIACYPGPCACPYNRARNNSQCGRRSAYSRAGGYDTLCYRKDVSADDIEAYRKQHGLVTKQAAGERLP